MTGKIFRFLLCIFLVNGSPGPACAQQKTPEPLGYLNLNFNYAYQFPGGSMSEIFSANSAVGLEAEYLLRSGWFVGAGGDFLFGNNVRKDVLQSLRTSQGYILGDDNDVADVSLAERGIYGYAYAGKLFKFPAKNKNTQGLRLSFGAGFFQHNIRLTDNRGNAVQIAGLYANGYDRLSNGPAISQFIGYQYMSAKKTINFFAGLDLIEGLTKNRRYFNFDTRQIDDAQHFDLLYGVRAGWILTIHTFVKANEIEY